MFCCMCIHMRDKAIEQLTVSESSAISYIRIFAFLCIICCHFLQYYENHWAWILNVGVQIFFAISGYLYGRKDIINVRLWAFRRIKKLYVPFIIVVFCTCVALYLGLGVIPEWLNVVYLFNLQGILGKTIPGLTHLWFMTAIMLCYIITPILQFFRRYSSEKMLLFVAVIFFLDVFWIEKLENICTWLSIYAFCYFFSSTHVKLQQVITIILLVVAGWMLINFRWNVFMVTSGTYYLFFHVFIGILFVISIISLAKLGKWGKTPGLVHKIDAYTFPLYLTHHIFILGPFSLLALTHSNFMNVCITLICTLLSAMMLKIILEKINE